MEHLLNEINRVGAVLKHKGFDGCFSSPYMSGSFRQCMEYFIALAVLQKTKADYFLTVLSIDLPLRPIMPNATKCRFMFKYAEGCELELKMLSIEWYQSNGVGDISTVQKLELLPGPQWKIPTYSQVWRMAPIVKLSLFCQDNLHL